MSEIIKAKKDLEETIMSAVRRFEKEYPDHFVSGLIVQRPHSILIRFPDISYIHAEVGVQGA